MLALQSSQHALDITVKPLGEEHQDTAQSYINLEVTQHALGNFSSALQSHQRSLDIRLKLFSEEHQDTAQSYFNLICFTQFLVSTSVPSACSGNKP